MDWKNIGAIILKSLDLKTIEKELALAVVIPFLDSMVAKLPNQFEKDLVVKVEDYIKAHL